MGDKLLKKLTMPHIIGAAVVFAILIVVAFIVNVYAGIAALILGAALAVYGLLLLRMQRLWINDYLAKIEDEIEDTLRYSVKHHPLPVCVIDKDGYIAMTNDKFKDIFPDTKILKTKTSDVFQRNHGDLLTGNDNELIKFNVNDKIYHLMPSYLNKDTSSSVIVYMLDITELETTKVKYEDEKECIALVSVDNYSALIAQSPDDRKSLIAANIETAIRQWAATIEGALLQYTRSRYIVVFDKKHYTHLVENKFSILDDIRKLESDADFPVSLSIGIGLEGETPQQTSDYAAFALDLAFGRGGDQAVVKRGAQVRYYGGKVQVIEKRNKGKSRVMTHAMKRLMKHSSKVIIMGHRNPDMDSFGAAIGINRIAFNSNKDAYVVIDEYNYSLNEVYDRAEKTGSYKFIDNETAIDIIDKDTLLVVVDTHLRTLVECPELLEKTEKIVLIDHHRKMEGFIDNATLTYMEPSASSTSELIAEILQYDDESSKINKLESELLLAGIYVDTNGFSVNTGTRTFEAASWLRQNGASSTSVRQFLQTNMEDFKQRANIIANAEFIEGGIAISKNEGKHANAQTINAQAADELLDIKGILASFVIGETHKEVVVSARSLGEINVQTIMEKLGGGGHLTMAAAQPKNMTPDYVIEEIKKYVSEELGGNE